MPRNASTLCLPHMEKVPIIFLRWILRLQFSYNDVDTLPVSMAALLGYWRLHYFNVLALLSRDWRKGLMYSLDCFEGIACRLYLHCRRTYQSPQWLVDRDPWCHWCGDIRNRRAQAAIAEQMLFLHPYRRRRPRPLEFVPPCTIKYHGGLTVITGAYPPQGMKIISGRHSSVPSFQKKETTRRRSASEEGQGRVV